MSLETRLAVEEFETLAKAIVLRGRYRPGGDSGASLRKLLTLSRPALYPHVADPDRIDVGALTYVLRRLPADLPAVREITATREISPALREDFEPVPTQARRRPTYRTGPGRYVTAFRGGMSDLVDFISALTCYQIESDKIRAKYRHFVDARPTGDADRPGSSVWHAVTPEGPGLESTDVEHNALLHALSVEFRSDYPAIKALDRALDGGLLGALRNIVASDGRDLSISFLGGFGFVANYSRRAKGWVDAVMQELDAQGLADAPVHLISSNRHSVINVLSPWVRERAAAEDWTDPVDYARVRELLTSDAAWSDRTDRDAAGGIHLVDGPEHMPFAQIVNLAVAQPQLADPRLEWTETRDAALVNMDYAFGEEGFFLLNEISEALGDRLHGVHIVGKAGTLRGRRGDIMLPTYFVKQGSGDVYPVDNCLHTDDFRALGDFTVFTGGPMLTVAGTFLQSEEMLAYFRDRWRALGVEMEGTPYARALAHAQLRGRIGPHVATGIAYYASDVPLAGDLLSTPLGDQGAEPVYAVTIAILRHILGAAG